VVGGLRGGLGSARSKPTTIRQQGIEAQVKRRFRLTGSADIKRVRRSGKSYAHPLVLLYVAPADRPATRICVSAGAAIGNAVKRNRAKRLLRAAVSTLMPKVVSGFDLLLIARPTLLEADAQQACEALSAVLGRARLLSSSNGS
jgi:ribonuclease P protein component